MHGTLDTPASSPRAAHACVGGSPPRLAHAFLALGDDDHAAPARQPSPLLGLATLAASVVLALSAPLAWASAPRDRQPDQPAATPSSKAALPAPDDDGGDGGV
jgi:hypothetical protein